jgi:hypothetical protein
MAKHKTLPAHDSLCLDENKFIFRESMAFKSTGACAQEGAKILEEEEF